MSERRHLIEARAHLRASQLSLAITLVYFFRFVLQLARIDTCSRRQDSRGVARGYYLVCVPASKSPIIPGQADIAKNRRAKCK